MRTASLVAIALAMALPSVIAGAGSISELPTGARIRVQSPALGTERLVGKFVRMRGDTLLLEQTPSPFVKQNTPVVMDHRCRVEVSLKHGTYALQGAATGGALGLLFGLFVEGVNSSLEAFPNGERHMSAGPVLAGLAIGTVAGAAMGSAIPRDEWAPVTVDPLSVGFHITQPAANARAAVTVRF